MNRRRASLAFLAPQLALVGFFVLYPIGRVVYLSLTRYDGLSAPSWTGVDNYRTLLTTGDSLHALRNTALLLLGMPLWIVVPFLIAVCLFGRRRSGTVRAILLVPALLPPIVVGSAFHLVLADSGPVNAGLNSAGLGTFALPWLSSPDLVLVTVVLVIAWAITGSGVMFYSAGLSALPTEQVEAAILDGARWHQLVWHVYRPALRPVTRFWVLLLILSTVTSFFPWIFSLTHGGPGVSSTTLDYAVYVSGIVNSDLGLASALSVVSILFVVLVLAAVALGRKARPA